MMDWPIAEGKLALGDLALQSGATLHNATLAWRTHGRLSAAKDNVVIYPTSYSATDDDLQWLIGPQGVLDPTRWFIVIPNMFGNGKSSSPSNTTDFPDLITAWDNVQAQRRLMTQQFGVDHVACVYGWSMGAQLAYHWAAAFPELIVRAVINCGSARTSVHNQVFLAGLMAILEGSPEYAGHGRFSGQPVGAIKAFSRVYAGWALSQDFYRAGLHLSVFEAPDLEAFLQKDWEQRFLAKNGSNLYAQLRTWLFSDISANDLYGGDFTRALSGIRARVLLMPSETDLYFRTEDNLQEIPFLSSAELHPIPSVWGHRAGNPTHNRADFHFIREQVKCLLAT